MTSYFGASSKISSSINDENEDGNRIDTEQIEKRDNLQAIMEIGRYQEVTDGNHDETEGEMYFLTSMEEDLLNN